MRRAALLLCLIAFAASQAGDRARVRFIWPPLQVSDQDATRWQVRVEPHTENRALILMAADEDGPVRRSDVQLDGERSPSIHIFNWSALPAGELKVSAVLLNTSGEVARATRQLTVWHRGP